MCSQVVGGRKGRAAKESRQQTARNADYSCHIYSSCHLVMVVASLAGLRVLLLARVLVQVRVVFLLFVLFVDLVEPGGSWPDARDAGADLLRALRPGPPPLLPPGCYP